MSELKPRITENGIDYILVGDRCNRIFSNTLQIIFFCSCRTADNTQEYDK